MKYLFCFIALLMLNYSINGQERFDRFTINFGIITAVYPSNSIGESTLVPEAEFLFNLPLNKTILISTGIGIESGKHIVLENYSHLVWVNDEIGWRLYKNTYFWNLDFISMKVPVYISVPLKNTFFNAFTFGSGVGWLLSYQLTEESMPNTSNIKINRSFLDLSFGVKKKLFQFNRVSLSCTPDIGYRAYLTNYNAWQKKYFSGELKLNMSF